MSSTISHHLGVAIFAGIFLSTLHPILSGTENDSLSAISNSTSSYQAPPLPSELLGGDRSTLPPVVQGPFEIVADPHTTIETIVVQSQSPDDPFLLDLLRAVRQEIKVIVRVQNQDVAEELWETLAHEGFRNRRTRFRFLLNDNRPIKKWGRDPFIVLLKSAERVFTLIPAYPESPWFVDLLYETDLGLENLRRNNIDRLPTWLVEGGSISADDRFAYVGNYVISASRRHGEGKARYTRRQVIDSIESVTGRKLIVLASTDLHSDRYHIPVGRTVHGERTSVLADPVAALELIASFTPNERKRALRKILEFGMAYRNAEFLQTVEGADEKRWLEDWLNEEDLTKFLSITKNRLKSFRESPYVKALDEAELELKKNGIAVVRIPALNHSYEYEEWSRKGGELDLQIKTFFFPFGLYYTNVIQDSFNGRREVVIPKYGIKKLDDAAKEVYESLGCFAKVHQVRSVIEGTQGGGPRCRVQVFGFPDPVPVKLRK